MFFSHAVKKERRRKEAADAELRNALVAHDKVMEEKDEARISLRKVIRVRNGEAVKSTAYLSAVKDEPEEEGDVQAASA